MDFQHQGFTSSLPLLFAQESDSDGSEGLPSEFYSQDQSIEYEQRRQQKDLGAYYTDEHLAEELAELVVNKRVQPLVNSAINQGSETAAENALSIKICDPMVGGGVFLAKTAVQLELVLGDLVDEFSASELPMVSSREALFEHIVSRMLYGVDRESQAIRLAADNIASETNGTLSDRSIQSCLAPNLKQGDALFNLLSPDSLPNSNQLNFPVRLAKLQDERESFQTGGDIDAASEAASIREALIEEWTGPYLSEFPDWFLEARTPFLWELEFPEVFYNAQGQLKENPGFDIVIGNPPWDVVKHNDREFFDEIEPDFSSYSRSKRDDLKEELLADDDVNRQYEQYREEIDLFLDYVKSDRYYEHQTSGRYGHTYNTYKLATELAFNIAAEDGYVTLLTPGGIMGEAGSVSLRRLLFQNARVDSFWQFKARADVFDDIDQSFCVHVYQKGGETQSFRCVDELESVGEFASLYKSESAPSISASLVRDAAPETFSLIPARDELDVQILEQMCSHPLASHEAGDFSVDPTRELDETKHREYIIDEETKYRYAKGRCVFPLSLQPEVVDKYVNEEFLEEYADHYDQSRLVWRDVARPSLRRRMFVTIVPPGYGTGNSLNYVVPNQSEDEKRYLAGVMQSWAFEYRARQISSNSHMNMYVIRQVPIPRLASDDQLFSEIVTRVDSILNTDAADDDREQTLHQIDALVAHAYGFSEREFRHLLKRFPKLEAGTREQILNEFQNYASLSTGGQS